MLWIQRDVIKPIDIPPDLYIKNLQSSKELVLHHISKNNKIAVFSDYDCDGISSSLIMNECFRLLNYPLLIKIPNRYEGYGLSKKWIEENKDLKLIITVDNGITKVEEVELAKLYGIDVLITDHHNLPKKLPECLILNPKLDSSDFTKYLCGAGVAFYLARELTPSIDVYDILTVATIGDMVEVTGANRNIIKFGLERINRGKFYNEAFMKLFSGISNPINEEDIAFGVVPIINSIGRLEDVNIIFDYIANNRVEKYDEIVKINTMRKNIQLEFTNKIMNEIDTSSNIVIYNDNSIPQGLTGLIASNITNKFYKPSIILSNNKGSCRSIEQIDIYDVLFNNNSEYIKYGGGHPMAAGLTLSDYDKFKTSVEEYCSNLYFENRKYYWKEIKLKQIIDTFNEIEELKPFGQGNPKPNILLRGTEIKAINMFGSNKNVLSITLEHGIRCIMFKYDGRFDINVGDTIDIIGFINKNIYNGYINYQIIIEDLQY